MDLLPDNSLSLTLPGSLEQFELICPVSFVLKSLINLWVVKFLDVLEAVSEFLEPITGKESVYAVKLREAQNKRMYYAIVQFAKSNDAEDIISLANNKALRLEDIGLHSGCKIADEKLHVLWTANDVSVDFGIKLRKFIFLLKYHDLEYKLQLSYENIYKIEVHSPRGRAAAKYLLIQSVKTQLSRETELCGAPRIYKKDVRCSEEVYENPSLNYFRDTPDDQWVRTTDFTPPRAIGQSFTLCLELPYGLKLPDFQENFPEYKESKGEYILESGSSYSCNPDLGAMVCPPPGVDVPYDILFKVNSLVQHGYLPGPALDVTFFRLLDPRRMNMNLACIEFALEKLFHLKESCSEPSVWLKEQYRKYLTSKKPPLSPIMSLDSGLVYVRRVQITSCQIYCCGPEVNVSNRVLRNYPGDIDNFIRVSFVDEELDKFFASDLSPRTSNANGENKTDIYKRILSILRNGISTAGEFNVDVCFKMGLTAADIREWMGNFCHIRNVAKYAARLGQSFGSSTETLNVGEHEIEVIPDVVSRDNKYVFSDGIGKISANFAKKVAVKCGFKGCTPSAFQIRYGGYKGVVAVDRTSYKKLSLRRSMYKYESEHTKLDVLGCSKFQPCFLNRQLITLLSTLGIQNRVFLEKQRAAVQQLDAMLTDPLKAQEALDMMFAGESTNILKELLMCGYKPDVEPFISMMLQTFRASKLLELRTKTRILIPDGRAMMGCLDETRTLEYGEVFVQFSDKRHIGSESNQQFIIKRKVVVAKNPCLHPGDVRVLKAVDVPECAPYGGLPHPNECSGSDLDGDIYFVCWDDELIPSRQIQPMDYTPAPTLALDHDVTIEEVEEYFVNYMVNDSLGIIANAHTAFADREPLKAMSKLCIELAKLFSIAVDFPKTGVPAIIPQHLRVKDFPDFMEKPDKPTYQSCNVIGVLFREVKDVEPHDGSIRSFSREVARQSYDRDMEMNGVAMVDNPSTGRQ
ncbi:hypothetical protein Prudu_002930 [Prunus dulcis]|uniref:RNA-dependent RNA polymerase n=1 Tax=Prunus dulcis TaxID=3755 RepID=A0A4Y1QRX9_PRUDU|nr:hypothetical protein Prudu_002930 [Prunus dulcis]